MTYPNCNIFFWIFRVLHSVAWTLTLHCMLRTFGLSRIQAHANNSWLPYYMSHPLSFNVPRHKSSHNSREQNTLIYVILKWKNSFFIINYMWYNLIEKLYSSQLIRHIPPFLYILEFGLKNCITTIYSDGFSYPKLFWIDLEVCLDAIFFFLQLMLWGLPSWLTFVHKILYSWVLTVKARVSYAEKDILQQHKTFYFFMKRI